MLTNESTSRLLPRFITVYVVVDLQEIGSNKNWREAIRQSANSLVNVTAKVQWLLTAMLDMENRLLWLVFKP